jgi:hypothetical protein
MRVFGLRSELWVGPCPFRRDPIGLVPDYNAVVTITRV